MHNSMHYEKLIDFVIINLLLVIINKNKPHETRHADYDTFNDGF